MHREVDGPDLVQAVEHELNRERRQEEAEDLLGQQHPGLVEVVADPALERNTHTIRVSGNCGRMTLVLENVPAPDNPKTSWLACYSAIAALNSLGSRIRIGT